MSGRAGAGAARWLAVLAGLLGLPPALGGATAYAASKAPVAKKEAPTDKAYRRPFNLTLHGRTGRCMLRVRRDKKRGGGSYELRLALDAPCFFVHRKKKLQVHQFPKFRVKAALVVVGKPADAKARKKWNLKPSWRCGLDSQGVLLPQRKKRFVATKMVMRRKLVCRSKGISQKDVWLFAKKR